MAGGLVCASANGNGPHDGALHRGNCTGCMGHLHNALLDQEGANGAGMASEAHPHYPRLDTEHSIITTS